MDIVAEVRNAKKRLRRLYMATALVGIAFGSALWIVYFMIILAAGLISTPDGMLYMLVGWIVLVLVMSSILHMKSYKISHRLRAEIKKSERYINSR